MSREFKFRAWDGRRMHTVCRLGLNGFSTDLWSPSPVSCDSRFTANLELMQFTGLQDRDGAQIFEGDILKFDISGNGLKYNPLSALTHIVEFKNAAWGFTPTHPELHVEEDKEWQSFWQSDDRQMWNTDYFTVIGNIYANPELTEAK